MYNIANLKSSSEGYSHIYEKEEKQALIKDGNSEQINDTDRNNLIRTYKSQRKIQLKRQNKQKSNSRSKLHYIDDNFDHNKQKYEKLSQLTERLKNIHIFYKIRIDEERCKNEQRSAIFVQIIDEMEKTHQDKMKFYEGGSKRQGFNEENQNEGKNYNQKLKQVRKQGQMLKVQREQLTQKLQKKKVRFLNKMERSNSLHQQLLAKRKQLSEWQRLKHKESIRRQELLTIIENGSKNSVN